MDGRGQTRNLDFLQVLQEPRKTESSRPRRTQLEAEVRTQVRASLGGRAHRLVSSTWLDEDAGHKGDVGDFWVAAREGSSWVWRKVHQFTQEGGLSDPAVVNIVTETLSNHSSTIFSCFEQSLSLAIYSARKTAESFSEGAIYLDNYFEDGSYKQSSPACWLSCWNICYSAVAKHSFA